MKKPKTKWKVEFGASIFETSKSGMPIRKIGEEKFKTEKELAWFLYKQGAI